MDLRLTLPVLLLLSALTIAAGVDSALTTAGGGFRLEPGGPAAGGWTAVTMIGPFGGSPSLVWRGAPAEAAALVVIGEDIDAPAGKRVFWTVWNIPATTRVLEAGLPRREHLGEVRQGRAFDGKVGYAPPSFSSALGHRLRFTIYALDRTLALEAGSSPSGVRRAVRSHVMASSSWMVGGGW